MLRIKIMSELEKSELKNHHVLPVCVFIVANMVYGVCLQEVHVHVNRLNTMQRSMELPLVLMAADLTSLLILVRMESLKELRSHAEGLIVTFICQAVIGYLLNFWFIVSRNDSFVIGYFEPIVLLTIVVACTKIDISVKLVLVSFLLTICAGFTSGNIWIFSSTDRNGIIIFLIIFFTSIRNLGLKLLHEETLVLRLRKSLFVPYTVTIFVVGFVIASFHFKLWVLPIVFSIFAMFASVAMFYLTAFLMEFFNLLTISVIGLVAQICVNLVCVPSEHAHNVFITIFAVLIMICLIAAYFRFVPDMEPMSVITAQLTHHEIYTRMEFTIFTGIVCGILFYVFKPKLSERDLNNLHYVGLDNFVKKLLRHPVEPIK